jgi:hypothetical protein
MMKDRAGDKMASLNFTIDEALNILWANNVLAGSIQNIKPDRDGLLVTVAGGIEIAVRPESFHNGILRLSYSSRSWAFKLADKFGKVDTLIDGAIHPYPFLRRDNKSLAIDLNSALESRIKGIQIRDFKLSAGGVTIEF